MNSRLQCRLCAEFKPNNELINIRKKEAIKLNLEHKIQQCLNLNFNDSLLPKNVCLHCCEKVSSSYEFQEQVKKAQEILQASLAGNRSTIKEELSDSETNPYDYVESFIKNDEDDDDFVKKEEVDSDNESADFYKPLSTIIKLENKKKRGRKRKLDNGEVKKVKRKYIKTGQSKKKRLNLDPEKAKEAAERSELIRRIKDEWKAYKWICARCKEELPTVEDLRIHFEKLHKETPQYTCMECHKVYDSYYNFKRHVATHRNKFKYKCEICSRFFHRNKHYKNHLETHSPEKKYVCPKCGKHYKTTNSLRGHLRTHIPIVTPKYECDICHKKVNTKAGLIYHEKIHNGQKDFTCDQCGKTFLIHSTLKYHMKSVHSDVKPYCCEHCNRTFKTQQLLKTHQQVHSDDRKHACEVCGRRFHRKGTLVRHSSVHTGVLAFACEYCYKRFRTKQLLKVHTRQHTGERPYACLECNHHFTDSSNYIKHMKGKHGVISTRKNATYRTDPPPMQQQQQQQQPQPQQQQHQHQQQPQQQTQQPLQIIPPAHQTQLLLNIPH